IEAFEGYKRCKTCRLRDNKTWHRNMAGYYNAGVKQRVPITEDEKEKLLGIFEDACAFCARHDSDKLRVTRLIQPRAGGGDDFWNLIPVCTSCLNSRKGWASWEDWYKTQRDSYSYARFNRIVAHHNELPITGKKK